MDARNFMTWRGPCLVCGKVRRHGAGIFCGNFLRARGPFPPCLAVWCGECYHQYPHDPFPVQKFLEDKDKHEELVTEEKLAKRFRHGRNGDHLMGVPFECDICHFRNCNLRDPDWELSKDRFALLCIQRACLDALWSRETSTVSSNLNRLRLDYHDSMDSISMKDPLPVLGRTDICDKVGMKVAMMTLNAST